MTTAIVVGAGPNGLAAALRLAEAGVDVTVLEAHAEIGGGTRTAELTLPGVLHDVCSGSHPFGVASPYLQSLPLEEAGLEWRWAEVDLAHPLDDGRAGVMVRSLDDTAAGLGPDGTAWRRVFGPVADRLPAIAAEAFQPVLHVPRHPAAFAGFGMRAALPATWLARAFRTDQARALWAGSAAHVVHPLHRPLTSSVGVMLTAAGHAVGWPVAAGGSHSITNALARLLDKQGARIETGVRVGSWGEVAHADIVLFDTSPSAVVHILGDRLPGRVRRGLSRWRHGPGAFKLDLAVEGGIPWTNAACRRAGMLHVSGSFEEVLAAERDVHRGRMPQRPFVLVGQQYLADPSRSRGDVHPVWTYAHVPHGWTGDATDLIMDQLERFAPGTRDRVLATHVTTPAQFTAYNPNYVGGDVVTGANDPLQVAFRPRPALDPYALGIPGAYLCSAATPPGAGVHGMCGANAADAALADLRHAHR